MPAVSEELFRISRDKRIPLIANFEITGRCNLNCIHCYHISKEPSGELTLKEIKKTFTFLKDSGTMFLILTGGEPFLRGDILDILNLTKRYFSLIVFTNATLITPETAKALSEAGPFSVHVSMYSNEPEIHDKITGKPGSFKETMRGIELLLKEDIEPVIKCPVMNENIASINQLKAWAYDNKLSVKIDPFISPCYEKNACDIISRRIQVKEIKKILNDDFNNNDFRQRQGLECSAGKNMLGIDSSGNVYPCIAWRQNCGNIREQEFIDIWEDMKPDYSGLSDCRDCRELQNCGICPGVAKIEGKQTFCLLCDFSH
jgi:radical SAM protein with 4Fe4S-binding SPASM domain